MLDMARSEGRRLRGALVVALALHAGVAWFALRSAPKARVAQHGDPGADALLWLQPLEPGPPAPTPAPPAPPEEPDESASGSGATGSQGTAARAPASPTPSREAAGEGAAEADSHASSDAQPVAEAPADGAPTLSLDELGVGKNPFLAELALAPPKRSRRSARGLGKAIAEDIVKGDQRVGLGAEGPILKQLETEIRQSRTTPNSKARFRASIDRKGNLVGFELLDATSDYRPWRELAARLLKSLRGTALRVPKTGRGVSLDIAIESRVQLPSGADPGLAVDVLGIPVKKGGGERSHKISILSIDPGGGETTIRGPGGQLIHLPEPPKIVLFGLGFDPVDIAAPAQRVVHAHVENVTSEDIPDAEPEPSPAGTSSSEASLPPGGAGAAK